MILASNQSRHIYCSVTCTLVHAALSRPRSADSSRAERLSRCYAAQWPCRCLCCLSMVFSICVDDVIFFFYCAECWRGYIELLRAFLAARSLTQHLCLPVTQSRTWCCQQKEKDTFNSSLEWCHWRYCSRNSSDDIVLRLGFDLLSDWIFDQWSSRHGWRLRSCLDVLCIHVID